MKQTLYEILDVHSSASEAAIKSAYARMRERYLDLEQTDANAGENLKVLTLAYEVIVDPVQRGMYDQRIARQMAVDRQAPNATDAADAPGPSYDESKTGDPPGARSLLKNPWFIVCVGILLVTLVFLIGRPSKKTATPPTPVNSSATKAPVN